ncbi:MAG: secondary thiamine-phosphate synthase enzyme YjbQ [Gammaproteobacteria bacterium]
MLVQKSLSVATRGRGTYDVTEQIQAVVANSGVRAGLCHVFIHHTSASLMLCENADPTVRRDLETFLSRLVPDGDPDFQHTSEGPDDMPAHIRTVLTQSGLQIPVAQGRCALGTWQGIYIWEHRFQANHRRLTVTVLGELAAGA